MLSNDQLGVKLGRSAMSAQCPVCPNDLLYEVRSTLNRISTAAVALYR
jgi:hypothetical protein